MYVHIKPIAVTVLFFIYLTRLTVIVNLSTAE